MRRISFTSAYIVTVLIFSYLVSIPANSAELAPFSSIFSANLTGSFTLTGNTNQSCSTALGDSSASCSGARNFSGQLMDLNNDSQVMRDVKVPMGDIEASQIFNSSANEIAVPTGSTISKAVLFWFGTLEVPDSSQFGIAPLNEAKRGTVLLAGPADNCSGAAISSCEVDGAVATESLGAGENGFYVGHADVTQKIADDYSTAWTKATGHLSALYSVGNIQGAQGIGTSSGWSLVVVFANPNQDLQHIEIKSGLALVAPRSAHNIEFSEFDSPLVGDISSSVGVVGIDGDAGTIGDSLSIRGSSITSLAANFSNPSNNVMNSSISLDGQRSEYLSGESLGRSKNTFGVEADRYTLVNALEHGANSVRMSFTTSADSFYISGVVFATPLGKSELKISKYISGVTQGGAGSVSEVTAGDTLEYTVAIDNIGVNTATDVRLEDVFDDVHLTNIQTSTPGCVVVVSDLICASLGNLTPASEPVKVVVTAEVKPGTGTITNQALVTYGGHQGVSTAISNPVTVEYAKLTTDLALELNFTSLYVQAGQKIRLQTRLTNLGPGEDPSPQLRLTLPTGLRLVSPLPEGCTEASRKVICTAVGLGLGPGVPLLPGIAANLDFVFVANEGKAKYRVNGVVQTGNAWGDPNLENNFATTVIAVNHAPAAQRIFVVTRSGAKAVTKSISPYISDPDYDALQVQLGSIPNGHGSLKLTGTQLTYTPPQNYIGTFSVPYFLSDGRGGKASSVITVQVIPGSETNPHKCRGFVRAGC